MTEYDYKISIIAFNRYSNKTDVILPTAHLFIKFPTHNAHIAKVLRTIALTKALAKSAILPTQYILLRIKG